MNRTAPSAVGEGYALAAARWQVGPGRIYDRLAEVLLGRVGRGSGGLLLDLGAGRGAVSRAARACGWRAVALDLVPAMLHAADGADARVAGDAQRLPLRDGGFDAVVAAFSLNHVTQPAGALREAMRVVRPGGTFLASAYAATDDHPVKRAVDAAATEAGWEIPSWYDALRQEAMPLLSTVQRARSVFVAADVDGEATEVVVPFPGLTVDELLDWRLGMAHLAPFVTDLDAVQWRRLRARATALLGPMPPSLVRTMIVMRAIA